MLDFFFFFNDLQIDTCYFENYWARYVSIFILSVLLEWNPSFLLVVFSFVFIPLVWACRLFWGGLVWQNKYTQPETADIQVWLPPYSSMSLSTGCHFSTGAIVNFCRSSISFSLGFYKGASQFLLSDHTQACSRCRSFIRLVDVDVKVS